MAHPVETTPFEDSERATPEFALRSTPPLRTPWQAHDADVGIEILLGGKLAVVENHRADERPNQAEAHAERRGNKSKWHGDPLAVASSTPKFRLIRI